MSATTVTRFACEHPKCAATVEADGWAIAEGRFLGRRTVACPAHAPELTAAERARYEWECAEGRSPERVGEGEPAPEDAVVDRPEPRPAGEGIGGSGQLRDGCGAASESFRFRCVGKK